MKSNSKEADEVTEEVADFGNVKIAYIGEILDTQPNKLSGDELIDLIFPLIIKISLNGFNFYYFYSSQLPERSTYHSGI